MFVDKLVKNSSVYLPLIKANMQRKINSYISDQVLKGKYELIMKKFEEQEKGDKQWKIIN